MTVMLPASVPNLSSDLLLLPLLPLLLPWVWVGVGSRLNTDPSMGGGGGGGSVAAAVVW